MERDALVKSLIVFGGAGVGANLRYWIGGAIQSRVGPEFPWGTFVINVTGSLLIGLVMGVLLQSTAPPWWRLLVVVGMLGGYTTFSSFSLETLNLLQVKAYAPAFGYVFGSCAASFVGTWIGLSCARAITRT